MGTADMVSVTVHPDRLKRAIAKQALQAAFLFALIAFATCAGFTITSSAWARAIGATGAGASATRAQRLGSSLRTSSRCAGVRGARSLAATGRTVTAYKNLPLAMGNTAFLA